MLSNLETSLGRMVISWDEKGINRLVLPTSAMSLSAPSLKDSLPREAKKQLEEYFTGQRQKFDLPINWQVFGKENSFFRQVYWTVYGISWGETRTYGQVATLCGLPKAGRAVGQAMAKNPVPIIIPCHRVVAANGLGGFGGGPELKKILLSIETSNKLTN